MNTAENTAAASGKKDKGQLLVQVVIIVIFMAGLLIMLYPFYIDALNNYLDLKDMERTLGENREHFESDRAAMVSSNEDIKKTDLQIITDPFDQDEALPGKENEADTHLIGAVSIPVLRLKIPLYDKTSSELLGRGATVLQGTSFPVGGSGTHSVISAHRGLPDRELFTNLPKLEKGDIFLLDVLGETLAYEVFEIKVVEPHQTDVLALVEDEDLVSLLTCTPYMINSHRLIVTGRRVPISPLIVLAREKADQKRGWKQLGMTLTAILLPLVFIFLLYRSIRRYNLSRRRISLKIWLDDSDLTLTLYNKQGRKPLWRDGEIFQLVTDTAGQAVFPDLPANIYCIKTDDAWIARIGIKTKSQDKLCVYKLNPVYRHEVMGDFQRFRKLS